MDTLELDRKSVLKTFFGHAGWKIFEEEILKTELDGTILDIEKLCSKPVSAEDLPKLNGLLWQKSYIQRLGLLAESLKEEAQEDN